jgi:hypothetical protein
MHIYARGTWGACFISRCPVLGQPRQLTACAHPPAVNGPPEEPLFNSEEEAAVAVDELLGADVVLTSYTVMQQV